MAITAAEVNKLRQATGAGMMDCKNALVEANGDFELAIDILRKKGQKVAAKRADRDANEGRAIARVNADATFGVALAVTCETDFVGKNEDFVNFAESIMDIAMEQRFATREDLLAFTINGVTVADSLIEMTGKTGEKIEIPTYQTLEAPAVAAYNHFGNRIVVISAFTVAGDAVKQAAHNVSMQIAAMNPVAVNADAISQETIDRERALAEEMTRQEGKPENMIGKIVDGKMNKFFKENTLLSQEYISDNKINVGEYLKQTDENLTCTAFYRIQIGE